MKRKIGLLAAFLIAAALATPAMAHEAGQWIVRGGPGTVSPKSKNADFGDVTLADDSVIESSYFDVDDGTSLVASFTYMLNKNWGIDILLATPFSHDVDLKGTLDGAAVTVPAAEVKHLPPTFSLQYHFSPDATFQPYVGFGVNYTLFFDEKVTQPVQDNTGLLEVKLPASSGLAVQLGADYVFDNDWLVNVDLRWMQIRSNYKIKVDLGDGNIIGNINVPGSIEIDPMVYSINVGKRF